MSPGRNPQRGLSPSRHSSTRVLAGLLSWYQAGKPFSALTGPTDARPPGFFTVTAVVASALVVAARGRVRTAVRAIVLRVQRCRRLAGMDSKCWPFRSGQVDIGAPRSPDAGPRSGGAAPRRAVAPAPP